MQLDIGIVPVAELEDLEPVRVDVETRSSRVRNRRATRHVAWSLVMLAAVAAICARPLGTYAGAATPHAAVPVHGAPPDLRALAPGVLIATSFIGRGRGYGVQQLWQAIGVDSAYARFIATSDGGTTWSVVGQPC
jgi:hypothetical protein